jgi:hypothetical protein
LQLADETALIRDEQPLAPPIFSLSNPFAISDALFFPFFLDLLG